MARAPNTRYRLLKGINDCEWTTTTRRITRGDNDNAQLTPRGELFVDIVNALLMIAMGYAILRAFAVVVVKLGQFLGIA